MLTTRACLVFATKHDPDHTANRYRPARIQIGPHSPPPKPYDGDLLARCLPGRLLLWTPVLKQRHRRRLNTRPTAILGAVERHIGTLHQGFRQQVLRGGSGRNANAHGEPGRDG